MPPQDLARRPRAALLGAVVLAVLVLHAWMLGQWPGGGRFGLGGTARPALQFRPIQAVPPRPAAEPEAAAAEEAAAEPPAPKPETRLAAVADASQAPPPATAASEPSIAEPAPEAVRPPEGSAGVGDPATAAAPPSADAVPQGDPPPVYSTRLPAPASIRYRIQVGAATGQSRLVWVQDGRSYGVMLEAVDDHGQPLLRQMSHGGVDAAGLAPQRFLDRRRGHSAGAVNFQHDAGKITFSGPGLEYPLFPGVQDRLSWVPQLAAIVQAAGEVPKEVTLFVVGTRGGGAWTLVAQGEEQVATPAGAIRATRMVREPQGQDDWRVEVWVDPQRGGWPARLLMSVPRFGALFELQLVAGPGHP
jgi:hypothetical protein